MEPSQHIECGNYCDVDHYLPEWLARYNKAIFGTIYLVGVVTACAHWVLAAK
jgi:hypothetical protein